MPCFESFLGYYKSDGFLEPFPAFCVIHLAKKALVRTNSRTYKSSVAALLLLTYTTYTPNTLHTE